MKAGGCREGDGRSRQGKRRAVFDLVDFDLVEQGSMALRFPATIDKKRKEKKGKHSHRGFAKLTHAHSCPSGTAQGWPTPCDSLPYLLPGQPHVVPGREGPSQVDS